MHLRQNMRTCIVRDTVFKAREENLLSPGRYNTGHFCLPGIFGSLARPPMVQGEYEMCTRCLQAIHLPGPLHACIQTHTRKKLAGQN